MAYIIPDPVFAPLTGASTKRFLAYGLGRDLDDAFDNASRAAETSSPDSMDAWIEALSGSDVTPVGEDPLTWEQALGRAAASLAGEDLEPGTAMAVPVAKASAFTRTKLRFVFETTELMLPDAPTVMLPGDPRFEQAWTALEGVARAAGAVGSLERLDVAAVRRRFRPVATPNRDSGGAQFVVVDGDQIVSRGHRTATEAKKAAVLMLKELPATDRSQPHYDIYKLAARASGPFIEVRRNLLVQKGRAVAFLAEPKGTPVKVDGWLIFGSA